MTRMIRVTQVLILVATGFAISGCGGRNELEDYTAPLKVVERTEFYLTGLRDRQLPKPDYDVYNDPAISVSWDLISNGLPDAISKLDDQAIRDQATAKCDTLKQVFTDQVQTPVNAEPMDKTAAAAGVDQCLAIVAEIKGLLGE